MPRMRETAEEGGSWALCRPLGGGGRRGFLENQDAMKTMEGTAPASFAFKGEVGDVPHFPLKNRPRSLPRRRNRRVPLGRDAADVEGELRLAVGRACPCTVLGLAQQRLAPCVAQARGLLSVY